MITRSGCLKSTRTELKLRKYLGEKVNGNKHHMFTIPSSSLNSILSNLSFMYVYVLEYHLSLLQYPAPLPSALILFSNAWLGPRGYAVNSISIFRRTGAVYHSTLRGGRNWFFRPLTYVLYIPYSTHSQHQSCLVYCAVVLRKS